MRCVCSRLYHVNFCTPQKIATHLFASEYGLFIEITLNPRENRKGSIINQKRQRLNQKSSLKMDCITIISRALIVVRGRLCLFCKFFCFFELFRCSEFCSNFILGLGFFALGLSFNNHFPFFNFYQLRFKNPQNTHNQAIWHNVKFLFDQSHKARSRTKLSIPIN